MHLRHRAVVGAAVMAAAVGLMVSSSAGAGAGVSVNHTVTNQWPSGYQAAMTITNGTGSTLQAWRLEFDLSHRITSLWNGVLVSQVNNHVVVDAPSWQRDLAAGASVTDLGYVAALSGPRQDPVNCRINGIACSFTGTGTTPTSSTPTSSTTSTSTTSTTAKPTTTTTVHPTTTTSTTVRPTTTTSTTVQSTTTTSTTTPGGGTTGGVPPFAVAPYADTTLWPTIDLPALARADGVKTYTLGFIVNGQGSCRATWGTYYNLNDNWLADQVAALRSMGGDVVVSFGGAANQELAQVCPTVDTLAAQYQAVVDHYGLTSIDFDVEGAATADALSIDRRSKALAQLQQQARATGRKLQVSLTLPVMPFGLTADGLNVVRSARDNGVDVSVVNVMAMDYGSPSSQMGTDATNAATSTHDQLASLYPAKPDAQLWAMVGVTPMIGQNDVGGEVFTTADARQLTDFAVTHHLGRLAMWSANRDSQCGQGVRTVADNLCSGVLQAPNEFATTFGRFRG
jgi:hypothetical protein